MLITFHPQNAWRKEFSSFRAPVGCIRLKDMTCATVFFPSALYNHANCTCIIKIRKFAVCLVPKAIAVPASRGSTSTAWNGNARASLTPDVTATPIASRRWASANAHAAPSRPRTSARNRRFRAAAATGSSDMDSTRRSVNVCRFTTVDAAATTTSSNRWRNVDASAPRREAPKSARNRRKSGNATAC